MPQRSATIGKAVVRGEQIDLHLEKDAVFEVERGDALEVTLVYDFKDLETEKEHTRIRLDVSVDGLRQGVAEHAITDVAVRNDSHRGALSVRARVPRDGAEGSFQVDVEQLITSWTGKDAPWRSRQTGSGKFRVKVK